MGYNSVLRSDLFEGQTIVITGGGSGIGRCLAHELVSLGATVIIMGRKEEKLAKVVLEIEQDGGKASLRVCDIRVEEQVQEAVRWVCGEYGQIHGLVNNAGGQFPAPLATINQKGFETVIRTNLVGGFLMAREVFSQSMCDAGGAIVNMTADHWGGMPGMGHSGAARAGMTNFTMTAAFEWGPFGVRVNAVAPGWVASSGMDTYQGPIRELIPKLKDAVPIGRLANESEVSSVISFLLSPAASFINGATIRIDGGASVGNMAVWPWKTVAQNVAEYQGFHRAEAPEILNKD